MKVAIIGTGYVGLPTGVGLAELGHDVVCIDREQSKIERLKAGQVTLFEEGLSELLTKNVASGRIAFTTSMDEGVKDAQVVLIAVGTPSHPVTHEADLRYVYEAATELAYSLKDHDYTVIATKSTVPVGTGDNIESLMYKISPELKVDVVSLPEFLREGYAVHDFFYPDRIVIGANSERARKVLGELYAPLLERSPQTKLLYVQRRSSETIKYAANSFLATKIHFINEIADFCEHTGADIAEVAEGMGLDHRIGPSFLRPGPGFGGSCFPKDTLALDYMAHHNGLELSLVNATIKGNRARIARMAKRILSALEQVAPSHAAHHARSAPQAAVDEKAAPAPQATPCLAILGLAFKNGTDDCRTSPALQIVEDILKQHRTCVLRVFDPEAMTNAQALLSDYAARITYCANELEACTGADVLAVLTEWPQFADFDLAAAHAAMRSYQIIDCRNLLDAKQALALGFTYQAIGSALQRPA